MKAIAKNDYEAKQERRRERLAARADKERNEAEAQYKRSRALVEHIPFGQPILVGHHSERRHRNALDKSWKALGRSVSASNKADALDRRAAGVGKGGISSDDPEAIVKLKEKLAGMEASQKYMAAVNAAWRKAKKPKADDIVGWQKVADTLGEPLASLDGTRVAFARDPLDRAPFAAYALQNNNGNMRRVKDRIAHLERQHARAADANGQPVEVAEINGVRIVENLEANRLQMFFPGKPAAEIRAELKRYGFRWSPSAGAWQRHISTGAKWSAEQIVKVMQT